MTEAEIIRGLKEQKEKAMEELLIHYGPLMKYIISPILENPTDREECLQEITMKVWSKIGSYDETGYLVKTSPCKVTNSTIVKGIIGFPQYVLEDLEEEEILKFDGALEVAWEAHKGPVNDGRSEVTMEDSNIHEEKVYDVEELKHTGVAVKLPGNDASGWDNWRIVHYYRWLINPGFRGTEAIEIYRDGREPPFWYSFPEAEEEGENWINQGEVTGKVICDLGEKMYKSPFYSIEGTKDETRDSFGHKTIEYVFATFSYPKSGENQRAYLTYDVKGNKEITVTNSWAIYTHQSSKLNYPALSAKYGRIFGDSFIGGDFYTVADNMQVEINRENR